MVVEAFYKVVWVGNKYGAYADACAGFYGRYYTVQGVDTVVPVDVSVPLENNFRKL